MKLLFCKKCEDVFRIWIAERRTCKCGDTSGQYHEDGLHADFRGQYAIPLGFDNWKFVGAVLSQPKEAGMGLKFDAFVIPQVCNTYKKTDGYENREDNPKKDRQSTG